VARTILLLGNRETGARLVRETVLSQAGEVKGTTFRSAGSEIGALKGDQGLRFFDSTEQGRIAFGPGAGLVVGVSVGAESVRAVLVDANGWAYHHFESERLPGQLDAEPRAVLDRIKHAAGRVMDAALSDQRLLVDHALPLLGVAVAWPTAVDRVGLPAGHSLTHPNWRNGQSLTQRVERHLKLRDVPVYALNDAHAAAIAVAHRETHNAQHLKWTHPKLTVVLRLAGNIDGAVTVLEPPQMHAEHGRTSGFVDTVLLGGVDNHTGRIGHAPVTKTLVDELNHRKTKGLGQLKTVPCSCVANGEASPCHLQSYASVLPLTRRVYPKKPRGEALDAILSDQTVPAHTRALEDVGALVGDALIGPVTMLNPAKLFLTGSLALSAVHEELERRLDDALKFGTLPDVDLVKGQDNDFVRATGAALALIRNQVHRRLDELLHDEKATVARNVEALTVPVLSNPW
jgi:predicted NBD/HSP70 family sugar kinase